MTEQKTEIYFNNPCNFIPTCCNNCSICKYNLNPQDEEKIYTNRFIEHLWREFSDVGIELEDDLIEIIDMNWRGWPKGTPVDDIWHWFDYIHSKGVGWMYENIDTYKEDEYKYFKTDNPIEPNKFIKES